MYQQLKEKTFVICGTNVIESDEHIMSMASQLKDIFAKYDTTFIFKTSFDKANRSSLASYRGLGMKEGLRILKRVKDELRVPIITDIHEASQAKVVAKVVDIIQIPAFLCRQTDLLRAAAETGKIIHVKKGQFCSAEQMHKCKEKLIAFGNDQVILCERGNSFGYQDLVVDPRNLIWLKSPANLVSMDITHCLQKPSQKDASGVVKSGGYRELIPYMGKMAMAFGVNGIFMEVHDRPDKALCDAPTQWYLDKLEWLLDFVGIPKIKNDDKYNLQYNSSSLGTPVSAQLGTIESDSHGLFGKFDQEELRGEKILNKLLEKEFNTVLDVGAGALQHAKVFLESGKTVDICDYGNSVYYQHRKNVSGIRNEYFGDFNTINFAEKYDAIWCSHILEHQPNVGIFLKKLHSLLKEGGYLAIVVPPRKPFLIGGHVTTWNAGFVLYNLVLAGFDCSQECYIRQYDYNIGVIVRKKSIKVLPKELSMDRGDIELLADYFPFPVKHGTNGDIMHFETPNGKTAIECDVICSGPSSVKYEIKTNDIIVANCSILSEEVNNKNNLDKNITWILGPNYKTLRKKKYSENFVLGRCIPDLKIKPNLILIKYKGDNHKFERFCNYIKEKLPNTKIQAWFADSGYSSGIKALTYGIENYDKVHVCGLEVGIEKNSQNGEKYTYNNSIVEYYDTVGLPQNPLHMKEDRKVIHGLSKAEIKKILPLKSSGLYIFLKQNKLL